jgi:PAS domain S-box-containing protein
MALLVDREGIIRWANERSQELVGYRPDELAGESVEKLVPPNLHEAHVQFRELWHRYSTSLRHSERPGWISLYSRGGEQILVDLDFVPWTSSEYEFFLLLVRRATTSFLDPEIMGRQRFQAHALTLAKILSRQVRRGDILDALAEGLWNAFEADSVSVWEVDEKDALVLQVSVGNSASEVRPGYVLHRDDSHEVLVQMARGGHGEVLRDVSSSGKMPSLWRLFRLRSAIVVPVRSEGEPLLVVVIGDRDDPERFSQLDLMEAHLLVHLAAASLQRSSLLEQTQNRLERLQTLREIDLAITSNLDPHFTIKVLLEETLDRLGVGAVAVLLLEPETMTFQVVGTKGFKTILEGMQVGIERGFFKQAMQERRALYVELSAFSEGRLSSLAEIAREEGFRGLHIAPMISKQRLLGVLEVFHREPPRPPDEWTDFLEALASQAAIAVENANLLSELQRNNFELRMAYEETLKSWGKLLELRDQETKGHTDRVVELTARLAREMGIKGKELMYIRWGAILHDIGKLSIPDAIIFKPGKLTDEEWEAMRRHPGYAYEVLSEIDFLRPALHIPYCHHERWDGKGYPRGLKGEEIPLAARIFAVVDAWDAMISERPYRGALSREEALHEIKKGVGTQFDPEVVKAFLLLTEREKA